jgi:hypothetical protein
MSVTDVPSGAARERVGSGFRLGRLRRAYDPRIPHMSALIAGKPLPPPPASADYTAGMPANLGMMRNDTLGDCTCAAVYHALQVWTFRANPPMVTEPDIDVVDLYEQACGYNPTQPGEGPGGNEQKVLKYLVRTGAPAGPDGEQKLKIAAFVEVDPRMIDDVKSAIADCGVAYIGFNVPQFLMPADGPPPAVWDIAPGQDDTNIGGHAVVLAGYDANGARVISWGQYYTMTWAFFSKFVDEVYALACQEWFDATGKSPLGMTMDDLRAQMQAIKGAPSA